jgi:hypothetical protein
MAKGAGGPAGMGSKSMEGFGGPSKSGPGAAGPAGMGAKSTAGFAGGVVGKGGKVGGGAKKQSSLIESLIGIATTPIAMVMAQPISKFTQSQIAKVAAQPGSQKIMFQDKVVGVRDEYGRLTGRDPYAERPEKDNEDEIQAEKQRKAAALAQQEIAAPTDLGGKEVIRTALAKETEAARRLGKRSLLSKMSFLG